jgi:hypothetical protein
MALKKYQMAIKYTKAVHSVALKNTKIDIFGMKYTKIDIFGLKIYQKWDFWYAAIPNAFAYSAE